MNKLEQLQGLLEQIKDDENLTKKYMETFDEFFDKLKQDEPNSNVLECVFTNFINLAYRPTKTYKFLINQLALAEKLLTNTFTQEQQRLYEIYEFLQLENSNNYAHKAFIYGYKLGDSIRTEINYTKLDTRVLKDEIKKFRNERNNKMRPIIQAILLVAEKYNDKVNGIISGNTLTIEYLYTMPGGEIDVYKTMEINEFEDKLSIKFFPERATKIIEVNELEDIFEILNKQICKVEHTEAEVQAIKDKYSVDTKIKLIKMFDLYAPPAGTIGTVTAVDDLGQLHVNWENGSSLALVIGTDEFEIIDDIKETEE